MKKIDFYKSIIENNIGVLKCPICGNGFSFRQNAVVCASKHCYDISSKGYLNFMTGTKTDSAHYGKALFESRRYVFAKGFFKPLTDEIKKVILQLCDNPAVIMDVGCGEGSALRSILDHDKLESTLGVGIDILKQAINIAAAGEAKNILWVVGDLASMPFSDNSADVLINMLSPANYAEFDRIMNQSGIVIKVLPGEDYLGELRAVFYKGTEKESYSNDKTAEYFMNHYPESEVFDLKYDVSVDIDYLKNLALMSPLSSGKYESEIFDEACINKITANFKILIGKAKI